jgi:chitinase domain-containing protein 1
MPSPRLLLLCTIACMAVARSAPPARRPLGLSAAGESDILAGQKWRRQIVAASAVDHGGRQGQMKACRGTRVTRVELGTEGNTRVRASARKSDCERQVEPRCCDAAVRVTSCCWSLRIDTRACRSSSLTVSAGDFSAGHPESAGERGLVKADVTAAEILEHSHQYWQTTNVRHFTHGFTLGYVTPWNTHGYDVAKKFALKFTHISPVWFQIKLKNLPPKEGKTKGTIKVTIEGGHDADAKWIQDVKDAGSDHGRQIRVAIVPRFIVEPESPDLYVKLAQREGLQKIVISKIQKAIEEHQLDGMVLEMTEAWAVVMQQSTAQVRNELNAFIMRLGAALHSSKPAPKQLILVVRPHFTGSPYFQNFDFQRLHKYVDAFSLMTYDHPNPNGPGPNAPIKWVKDSILALIGEEEQHNLDLQKKILAGVPFYGYRYPAGEQPRAIVGHEVIKAVESDPDARVTYDDVAAEHIITVKDPKTDTEEQIYYPTLYSFGRRLDLARSLGASLSIWEIGQGMDVFYDLL